MLIVLYLFLLFLLLYCLFFVNLLLVYGLSLMPSGSEEEEEGKDSELYGLCLLSL